MAKKQTKKEFNAELKFKPMEGFGGGFRTAWISVEGKNYLAGLDSGAGLGNAFLTFWFERKGKKREYYIANITDVLKQVIEKV